MKKTLSLLLAMSLTLALAACGGGGGGASSDTSAPPATTPAASSAPAVTPESEPEPDPMVESIDLDCETGRLAYSSFQINDENFGGHAVILIFDFTNKESKPTGVQDHFLIKAYQNGVEVEGPSSWTNSPELPEAVDNFFNTAMKDGTMPIARTFMLKDDSPLTIMAEYKSSGDYQMMELDISAQSGGETGGDAVDAETIDAALQGGWSLMGNVFSFKNGALTVAFTNGQSVSGTYTIDTEASAINGTLQATDGSSNISLPYKYEDGALTLYNNQGQALERV